MVAGAKVVSVPLSPECDAFDIPALKAAITPRSRLIIVNSPSNPTGGVMTAEHLVRARPPSAATVGLLPALSVGSRD